MTEELTREQIAEKYEANFQKFIDGLEKLSKQCGIAISACGCSQLMIWTDLRLLLTKETVPAAILI